MTTEPTEAAASRPETVAAAPAAAAIKPGALIREARQAARLSVDDLAGMIKLARPTVEAMERDDFAALLEPVYARGYYRKCAKVLGIDEKILLDAYSAHVAQRGPVMPNKVRLASGSELGIGSRLPIGRAIVLAVGAIILCALLWLVREATIPAQDLPAPTMLPSGSAPDARPAEVVASPAPAPATEAAAVAAAAADAAPAAATTAVTEPVAAQAPAAAPIMAGAPVLAAPPAPVGSAQGALQLVFTADCWVNIRDANGKALLKGLVLAGQRVGLDGMQPFSVFIGKASAVGLRFNGKPVDLAPYTRDNATAKLSLPLSAMPAAAPAPQ